MGAPTAFASARGLLALTPLLLGGCLILGSRPDTDRLGQVATLQGQVIGGPHDKPSFVVLYRWTDQRWERFAHRTLFRPGTYEFTCPSGRYLVFAFQDENEDLRWQDGEPAGRFGSPRGLEVAPGALLESVDLKLGALEEPPPFEVSLSLAGTVAQELSKVHRGDLASLDEERFTPEAAAFGLWQPVGFASKWGVGVSFLEPYEPGKIPVLFIHGAAGTPRDFQPLIGKLDRAHFQPWVFSYPSGLRLGQVSTMLRRITDDLQHRLGFQQLHLIAHSMGGLIAREVAAQVAMHAPPQYVASLVTISTPWAGHEAARSGVQLSPVVVPSWIDLAQGSPFLTVLLEKPLPPQMPHFLFFSFEGSPGGDGTVSLRSQLDPRVQGNARRVIGLDCNHTGILKSAALSEQLGQVLAIHGPNRAQTPDRSSGMKPISRPAQ